METFGPPETPLLVAHPVPDRAVLAWNLETGERAVVLTRPVDSPARRRKGVEGRLAGARGRAAAAPDALVEDQDALGA